jgi:photosystem II stability/assembly factor-like uncharacterized protein
MRDRRFGIIPALGMALLVLAAMATTGSGTTFLSPSEDSGQVGLNIRDLKGDLASLECKTKYNPAACERIHELTRGHPESIMEHLKGYEEFFYGPRSAPGTRVPAGAYAAAVNEAKLRGSIPAGTWTSLGPQPINSEDPTYQDPVVNNFGAGWGIDSGRVTTVETHPTNNLIAYMGAADGGVWKTTNGGTNWKPTSDGLPTQAIGDLALAPASPQTLYAGTGEASTNQDAYYGMGVFKTTNGGTSWAKVGGTTFDRKTVFKIITKNNGSLVLVATNKGLYRSNDGGGTWTATLVPGDPELFQSFISDVVWRDNGTKALAVVGWRGGAPTNGIYESSDNGSTWRRFQPTGYPPNERLGRTTLAVDPAQPNVIYALIQDAEFFNVGTGFQGTVLNGVHKTTGGIDGPWTKVVDAQELASDPGSAMDPRKIGPGFAPGVQAWYNQYLIINPANPNHLILGLEEIYQSLDGGQNWDTIGRYWNFCYADPPWPESPWCNSGPGTANDPKTTHPDQHDAQFMPNGSLLAGNDGGMWSQSGPTFNNDDWRNLNETINTAQCYYGDMSADGTALCGMQDNGTGKFEGSKRWPLVTGGDGGDVAIEPHDSSDMWSEYVFLTTQVSSDGGRTWTVNAPPDPFPRFIAPYEMDPRDEDHVIAGGQVIWETTDGVETTSDDWTNLYNVGNGHQSTAVWLDGDDMYAAWCGPCNPTQFTPGTPFQRGLATNVGGSWHQVAVKDVPNRYITSVIADPSNPQHVYITLSAFARRWIPDAGIGHVFESFDAGERFTDISGDLPDAPANDLVLHNGKVIVATDVGVFQWVSGGSWKKLGTGLPAASVLDITVQEGTNNLVAATHGRGVWKLAL